jgi:hypothetical protein
MRYTKLTPESKALWLEALRSGDYEQTTGMLHRLGGEDFEGWCCLGVLCDIAPNIDREEVLRGSDEVDGPHEDFDGCSTSPSRKVWQWAVGSTDITLSEMFEQANALISMNDDQCKSFSEIADWIEENL